MVNPPYCFNGGLHPGLFVAGASPQRRPLAAPLSADLAAAGGTAHQKMDETICHAHMLHAWYIYPICGRFFGANVGISYMEHMAWGLTWFMQSVTYFFLGFDMVPEIYILIPSIVGVSHAFRWFNHPKLWG